MVADRGAGSRGELGDHARHTDINTSRKHSIVPSGRSVTPGCQAAFGASPGRTQQKLKPGVGTTYRSGFAPSAGMTYDQAAIGKNSSRVQGKSGKSRAHAVPLTHDIIDILERPPPSKNRNHDYLLSPTNGCGSVRTTDLLIDGGIKLLILLKAVANAFAKSWLDFSVGESWQQSQPSRRSATNGVKRVAASEGARNCHPAGGNNFFLYVRSSEVGAHADVMLKVEGAVTRRSPAEALAAPWGSLPDGDS
jgi:hypothetical protein